MRADAASSKLLRTIFALAQMSPTVAWNVLSDKYSHQSEIKHVGALLVMEP